MKLYCSTIDGVLTVVAVHDDAQDVPEGAYGEGVVVLPYAGPLTVGDLLGRPAPAPDLAAYAAARRYASETGGVTVGDQRIATDRGSQALVNGAFNLASVAPTTVFKFKAGAGFVNLDAAAIAIIAESVGRHVQACFAKEAEVVSEIAAGTIDSLAAVDAAFAPLDQPPPPPAGAAPSAG